MANIDQVRGFIRGVVDLIERGDNEPDREKVKAWYDAALGSIAGIQMYRDAVIKDLMDGGRTEEQAAETWGDLVGGIYGWLNIGHTLRASIAGQHGSGGVVQFRGAVAVWYQQWVI